MKGLILKDLINLKKQAITLTVLIGFYVLMALVSNNNSMLGGITAVMCGMLPITALSYDEKAKWDKYALSMPVSRTDMVMSKYLLGFMLSCAALIFNLIFNLATSSESIQDTLLISFIFFAIGILFMSFMMPILFKFGVEKGRIMMMIVLFAPTGFVLLLSKSGLKPPSMGTLKMIAYASPFLVIAILAVSIALSLKIYKNKEM